MLSKEVADVLGSLADDAADDAGDQSIRRELINGLRNVLAAIFQPVSKGVGVGLERLAQVAVLTAGAGGMAFLVQSYPAGFAWLLPWLEKLSLLAK